MSTCLYPLVRASLFKKTKEVKFCLKFGEGNEFTGISVLISLFQRIVLQFRAIIEKNHDFRTLLYNNSRRKELWVPSYLTVYSLISPFIIDEVSSWYNSCSLNNPRAALFRSMKVTVSVSMSSSIGLNSE